MWLRLAISACCISVLILFLRLLTGFIPSIGSLFTRVFHLRFPLVLVFAPGVLGFVAWANPYLLLGLLLVGETRSVWLDTFRLTWMSFFTVGLGIIMIRLISSHAVARLASSATAVAPKSLSSGWPSWLIAGWWTASLLFPLTCVVRSVTDILNVEVNWHLFTHSLFWDYVVGIGIGWAFANFVAFGLALLQRWTLGQIDHCAAAGILPFEMRVSGIDPWALGRWNVPGKGIITWLFGTRNAGLSWLLRGPGYTDPITGVLLPGHAQVLGLALFSLSWYGIQYFIDLNQEWTAVNYPTPFFALVIIFVLGFLLSGAAFWLDRFRVPVLLFVLIWLAVVYRLPSLDPSFDINHRETQGDGYLLPWGTVKLPEQSEIDKNVYMRAIAERSVGTTPEQMTIGEVLDSGVWTFPEGVDKKRTLVMVATSGGGIQSAAWTTKVLTELDRKYKGLGQSIFLISSVSGGSVGSMYYVGLRGVRNPKEQNCIPFLDNDARKVRIQTTSQESCLEACAWGAAFPDLVQTVFPGGAPNFVDRGFALETVWWNRMGEDPGDRQAMSEVTIRDMIPLVKKGLAPAVVFNATCVETGQRVAISPINIAVDPTDHIKDNATRSNDERLAMRPIDFLSWYDHMLVGSRTDPRVTTAVRLSATFSYVTPVARPSRNARWRENNDQAKTWSAMHYCDGGYSDNAGLVTIIKLLHDLLSHYSGGKKPPFDNVLVLRIEPFPPDVGASVAGNQGFQSAFFGPEVALDAARTSTRAERGELEMRLLQEVTNPELVALRQVSGTLDYLRKQNPKWREIDPHAADKVNGWVDSIHGTMQERGTGSNAPDQASKKKYHDELDKAIKAVDEHLQPLSARLDGLDPAIKYLKKDLGELRRSSESSDKQPPFPFVINSVTYWFPGNPDTPYPPLSWTLSRMQQRAIDDAWKSLSKQPQAQYSPRFFADSLSQDDLKTLFPE